MSIIRWGFAVLFFGIIILSFALHPRPLMRTDAPGVHHLQDLPPNADFAKLKRFMAYSGVMMPVLGARKVVRLDEDATSPALGYSYREVSMLGLPFAAYTEYGVGLYTRSDSHINFVPLDADYIALLEKETGAPLASTRGYMFPFWLHIWGWLVGAIGIAWAWWEWRDAERRKDEAGII